MNYFLNYFPHSDFNTHFLWRNIYNKRRFVICLEISESRDFRTLVSEWFMEFLITALGRAMSRSLDTVILGDDAAESTSLSTQRSHTSLCDSGSFLISPIYRNSLQSHLKGSSILRFLSISGCLRWYIRCFLWNIKVFCVERLQQS